MTQPNFQIPYAGGETPLVLDLDYHFQNVNVVLGGFTTDDATIEVLPVGGDLTTGWKTLTVTTDEPAIKVLNSVITKVRVSGLPIGTYTVTTYQF